jgi:hypothetical protein
MKLVRYCDFTDGTEEIDRIEDVFRIEEEDDVILFFREDGSEGYVWNGDHYGQHAYWEIED